jgi:hypothetical protein
VASGNPRQVGSELVESVDLFATAVEMDHNVLGEYFG